jgi:pre-60S factor REI1
LRFATAADQRTHFSDDLHRYNSKRRVANLPPVSEQVFTEKVLSTRSQAAKEQEGDRHRCEPCGCVCRLDAVLLGIAEPARSKTFMSENAYTAHLNSRKHKEALARPPAAPRASSSRPPVNGDTTMSDGSSPTDGQDVVAVKDYVESRLATAARIPAESCLFCPRQLADLDAKLEHMHKDHGFFLPDAEYLVDRAGLVEHAAEEVGVFNTCLYCGAMFARYVNEADGDQAEVKRAQRGLDAVRKHMSDKVPSALWSLFCARSPRTRRVIAS